MQYYHGQPPYGPYPAGQCYSYSSAPGYYYPQPCHHERRRYPGCSGWLMALLAFCCGCCIAEQLDTDCCCCFIPCPPCPRC
ncbi:Chromatin-remodeling ATPase INO80 [Dirofilaria immitis]